MNKILTLLLSLFLILHSSCSKDILNNDLDTNHPYLIENSHHYLFTGRILEAIAKGASNELQNLSFTNVEAIKVTYNTRTIHKTQTLASGILLIPDRKSILPVLSYQHQGGLQQKMKAPSFSMFGANELTHAAMIASTGYIVLVPDYLGYGSSEQEQHPFEHKASLAQSGLDFIRAVKEYLDNSNIKTQETISLAGYSEGAQISLTMHQLLEEEGITSVQKSIVADGVFLKNKWVNQLLVSHPTVKELNYFLKLIESYKSIYPNLPETWYHYLKDQYAEMIENGTAINSLLLNQMEPNELFDSNFIDGIVNGKDHDFIDALEMNDVEPWETKSPIFLFYYDEEQSNVIAQAKTFKMSFEKINPSIQFQLSSNNLPENPVLPFAIEVLKELHNKN